MVNVSLTDIDFEQSNVIYVNGLTLERVKIKYNWLLNAKVNDAIIGEDENGLVWYFGDWVCGEWYDGTWYSGTWHDGTWKNGNFYAYNLNKFEVLSNELNILNTDNGLSLFLNGIWENGNFYSGTFGVNNNEDWTDYLPYTEGNNKYTDLYYTEFRKKEDVGGIVKYNNKHLSTWITGTFHNGLMYDCVWCGGVVKNSISTNIQWMTGKWFLGTFDGHTWYNGSWYNGEFIKGIWKNGTFNNLNGTDISRFGNTILSGETICTWENGTWQNGEFFSGIVTDKSGNLLPSIYNNITIWENGTWQNGTWYGGHFKSGTWENGVWENGIFGDIEPGEWVSPEKISQINNSGWTSSIDIPIFDTIHEVVGEGDYTGVTLNIASGTGYTNMADYEQVDEIEWAPDGVIDGDGSDGTYWTFKWINNNYFTSSTSNAGLSGEVYIESESYNGYYTIDTITNDDNNYRISIVGLNIPFSEESGKIFKSTVYNEFITEKQSSTLLLNGFDFNEPEGKITGYQVKYKRTLTNDNNDDIGTFSDNNVWYNLGYNSNANGKVNLLDYPSNFFADDNDFNPDNFEKYTNIKEGYKNNTVITNVLTDVIYGKGFKDFWTLDNLSEYTRKIEDFTTNTQDYIDLSGITSVDYTDVNNVNDIDINLNLYMNFLSTKIGTKILKISDIKLRLYFEGNSGTWKNGTWKKGTWVNGTFEDGKFISGLWMAGDFKDGQIGGN